MPNALKSHGGLMVSGALAALGLHREGLPRRQRASVATIAGESADFVGRQSQRQLARYARALHHVRSREAEIAIRMRALRCEQLALRYRPGRVEDHLRALLREHPQADHLMAGAFGPNLIVNAGEAFLVDAWQGTVEMEVMRYHGCGRGNGSGGATDPAEGDTTLQSEETTTLNPEQRAQGSLGEAAASVFRTQGTLTFDGTVTGGVVEWGLFSQQAHGGGTMWSRIEFAAINVGNGDSIQFTYDLTVE
jgi:hypothetical protein